MPIIPVCRILTRQIIDPCRYQILPSVPFNLKGERMIAYGKVKTRHHGKDSTHRDCPICDLAEKEAEEMDEFFNGPNPGQDSL